MYLFHTREYMSPGLLEFMLSFFGIPERSGEFSTKDELSWLFPRSLLDLERSKLKYQKIFKGFKGTFHIPTVSIFPIDLFNNDVKCGKCDVTHNVIGLSKTQANQIACNITSSALDVIFKKVYSDIIFSISTARTCELTSEVLSTRPTFLVL